MSTWGTLGNLRFWSIFFRRPLWVQVVPECFAVNVQFCGFLNQGGPAVMLRKEGLTHSMPACIKIRWVELPRPLAVGPYSKRLGHAVDGWLIGLQDAVYLLLNVGADGRVA